MEWKVGDKCLVGDDPSVMKGVIKHISKLNPNTIVIDAIKTYEAEITLDKSMLVPIEPSMDEEVLDVISNKMFDMDYEYLVVDQKEKVKQQYNLVKGRFLSLYYIFNDIIKEEIENGK